MQRAYGLNPFDAEREAALGMGQLVAAQQGKGPYFFSTFSLGNRSTPFFSTFSFLEAFKILKNI